MYGIGGKTAEKISRMGIQTIGDLAKFDRNKIIKTLGKGGEEISLHANGQDSALVQPNSPGDMKSIGRSKTLPEDITDIEKAKIVLLELADDIGMTARKYGKKGRSVHITLKYSDFQVITRQTIIPATSITEEIYQAGCRLLIQNWNRFHPVRLIGINIAGFDEDTFTDQMSLFDIMEENVKSDKQKKIDQAMDKIRSRHGTGKISRATLIKKVSKN